MSQWHLVKTQPKLPKSREEVHEILNIYPFKQSQKEKAQLTIFAKAQMSY